MSNTTMSLAALQALPVQPHADAYPIVSDEELLELAQDIEENGLVHPLVLWNGHLLDGRNRLKALAKTKLTLAPVEYFDGTEYEAVCHIASLNVLRRHMTTGQRAFAALDFLPYEEAEALLRKSANGGDKSGGAGSGTSGTDLGKARDLAGERFNVNGQRVSEAKKLSLNAPDLALQVKSGAVAIDKAVRDLSVRQGKSNARANGTDTPAITYGVTTGSDTGWGREEPSSYEEQRATALEVLVRQAGFLGEKISRYAVVDGDVVDMPGLPCDFGATARQLSDLFGDVAAALGA